MRSAGTGSHAFCRLNFHLTDGLRIRLSTTRSVAFSCIPSRESDDHNRQRDHSYHKHKFLRAVHLTEKQMIDQTARTLMRPCIRKQITDSAHSGAQKCKHRSIHKRIEDPAHTLPDHNQWKKRYNKRKHPYACKQICPLLQHRGTKEILQIRDHAAAIDIPPAGHARDQISETKNSPKHKISNRIRCQKVQYLPAACHCNLMCDLIAVPDQRPLPEEQDRKRDKRRESSHTSDKSIHEHHHNECKHDRCDQT